MSKETVEMSRPTLKCDNFRLHISENAAGKQTMWLDLYGDSYSGVDLYSTTEFAKQLHEAAEWVEANAHLLK